MILWLGLSAVVSLAALALVFVRLIAARYLRGKSSGRGPIHKANRACSFCGTPISSELSACAVCGHDVQSLVGSEASQSILPEDLNAARSRSRLLIFPERAECAGEAEALDKAFARLALVAGQPSPQLRGGPERSHSWLLLNAFRASVFALVLLIRRTGWALERFAHSFGRLIEALAFECDAAQAWIRRYGGSLAPRGRAAVHLFRQSLEAIPGALTSVISCVRREIFRPFRASIATLFGIFKIAYAMSVKVRLAGPRMVMSLVVVIGVAGAALVGQQHRQSTRPLDTESLDRLIATLASPAPGSDGASELSISAKGSKIVAQDANSTFVAESNASATAHPPPDIGKAAPNRRQLQQFALSNDVVAAVQKGIRQRGYDTGLIDGIMGPRTRRAIRAYQRDAGLVVSGAIDPPLLRKLDLL